LKLYKGFGWLEYMNVNTLDNEIDLITEQLITKLKNDIEQGMPVDIKTLNAIRQTYLDKVELMKFLMTHELKQQQAGINKDDKKQINMDMVIE